MGAKLLTNKETMSSKNHEGNRQKLCQSDKQINRQKMDSQKKGGQTKNNNNQANK